MGHLIKIKLTCEGLLVLLANHQGVYKCVCVCVCVCGDL